MSFLNKFKSMMFKIFQIMDKLNKFSNQMTEPGLSDHNRKKTKRKYKRKSKNQRVPKKQKTTKPEILGFDYKLIGDRMMGQNKP